MSVDEKNRLLTLPFDTLWNEMWGETTNTQYKGEEFSSSKKMDIIRAGVTINNEIYTLNDIVNKSKIDPNISKVFNSVNLVLKSNNPKIHFFFIDYSRDSFRKKINRGRKYLVNIRAKKRDFQNFSLFF